VIVVGHSNCGGAAACVKAASAPPQEATTPLFRWLTPLANLARSLGVDSLGPEEALSLLVKENVRQQIKNLTETETIKNARARDQHVQIHGWVYELSTGKLSDLGMS
jgi:carbonic anhydrase